jgi:hypothetical protein
VDEIADASSRARGDRVTDLRDRPESLVRWLAFLKTSDCPCPSEWRSLGRLYGISMGKGWVRMSADPACRHHGARP